jgi:hypothetical protein
LKPEHAALQILVARAVGSLEDGRKVECDPGLVMLAGENGAKAADLFQTSRRVILTAEEKCALGAEADAVEMESFQVMEEAAKHGIRGVGIRAISDPVDMDLPFDLNQALDDQGAVSIPRVLKGLGRSPRSLPQLVRLGISSARAAAALARFLDRYVDLLAIRGASAVDLLRVEAR